MKKNEQKPYAKIKFGPSTQKGVEPINMKNLFVTVLLTVFFTITNNQLLISQKVASPTFPKWSLKKVKKAKIISKNKKITEGFIYDIEDGYIYTYPKKKMTSLLLENNCKICPKISIDTIQKIAYPKLSEGAQVTNAFAIVGMIAGFSAIASSSKDNFGAGFVFGYFGVPGTIIFTGNLLTSLSRKDKRTISKSELISGNYDDSIGFFANKNARYLLNKRKDFFNKLSKHLTQNPKSWNRSFIFTDKNQKSHTGYFVKMEGDIYYLTTIKSMLINYRENNVDTEIKFNINDIVSVEKTKNRR